MKILEDILKGILLISIIAVGVLFFYQKSVLRDAGVARENIEVDPFSGTEIRKPLKDPLLFPDFAEGTLHIYSDPEDEDILWIGAPGGLMQYDIAKREIKSLFDANDGLMRSRNMVRIGDNIFISNQGGFQKISAEGTLLKEYTVEDGLVNGSNLHLEPDPRDKNILWIGTFDGLSKFNIETEEFTNFGADIVPFGTLAGINEKFSAGNKYVWVAVNSNAHSSGGIGRFDKTSEEWDFWDRSYFGEERRVNVMWIHSIGDTAFARADDAIFNYDPNADEWRVVGEDVLHNHSPVTANEQVYFFDEEGLKYIDFDGSIVIAYEVEGIDDIAYSSSTGAIIVFDETPEEYSITLYNPVAQEITDEFSFSLPLAYQAEGAIFANDSFILFTHNLSYQHSVSILAYTFNNQELSFIENVELSSRARPVRAYELENGEVIVAILPACGPGGCSEGHVHILSPDNFEVLESYNIPYFIDDIAFDYSVGELYFISNRSPEEYGDATVFTHVDGAFEPTDLISKDLQTLPGFNLLVRNEDNNRKYMAVSNDGRYFVEADSRVEGNNLIVRYKKAGEGDFKEKSIGVKKPKYNPFGWEPSVSITNISFSGTQPGIVWIGTDRGLVNFNLNTEKAFIFEATGLDESFVVYAGERLILADDLGVYVYYK